MRAKFPDDGSPVKLIGGWRYSATAEYLRAPILDTGDEIFSNLCAFSGAVPLIWSESSELKAAVLFSL